MQAIHTDAPARARTRSTVDVLARDLGWLSLALGAAALLAPRSLARCSGLPPEDAGLVRACGARELTVGAGLLTSANPAPWLWVRVLGDALDLAGLSRGLSGPARGRAGMAIAAVATLAAIDYCCARSLSAAGRGHYVAPDYGDRSGFPKPAAEMRGAAVRKPEPQAGDDRPPPATGA